MKNLIGFKVWLSDGTTVSSNTNPDNLTLEQLWDNITQSQGIQCMYKYFDDGKRLWMSGYDVYLLTDAQETTLKNSHSFVKLGEGIPDPNWNAIFDEAKDDTETFS